MVRLDDELNDMTNTLYGKRWPSDELRALFNMVPDKTISVQWSKGLGFFTVRRYNAPGYYETVPANLGFDMEEWQRVLAKGLQFKHVSPPR